mmetsp:Transcript_30261/g.84561  ORF Transcript_30261/g.84561 Transcript_30261/m.84561 type:complete len:397 (+) Transcript_30261:405-1595(+)
MSAGLYWEVRGPAGAPTAAAQGGGASRVESHSARRSRETWSPRERAFARRTACCVSRSPRLQMLPTSTTCTRSRRPCQAFQCVASAAPPRSSSFSPEQYSSETSSKDALARATSASNVNGNVTNRRVRRRRAGQPRRRSRSAPRPSWAVRLSHEPLCGSSSRERSEGIASACIVALPSCTRESSRCCSLRHRRSMPATLASSIPSATSGSFISDRQNSRRPGQWRPRPSITAPRSPPSATDRSRSLRWTWRTLGPQAARTRPMTRVWVRCENSKTYVPRARSARSSASLMASTLMRKATSQSPWVRCSTRRHRRHTAWQVASIPSGFPSKLPALRRARAARGPLARHPGAHGANCNASKIVSSSSSPSRSNGDPLDDDGDGDGDDEDMDEDEDDEG